MIPDFSFVPAYLLFEMIQRNFKGALGIGRVALGFEHDAGIEVRRAVGAVSRSLARKNDMRVSAAVEVLLQRGFDAFANLLGERRSG